ncbi:pyridoxamine 5'-phosphate oxidase-related FMN-binding [Anaeromyxobacter dehalogenans 2CP-1]|uniref:Pyridoxamine 5'-phosphate oxidase-related FMN-binding n=1 Tax=Anaeromyxobacter dehalogenans (strain ATCC BAA-258 / DSM 21875 / 2CP-1) TaxID=455488 RepID=B8JC12_ANAD2|nr:pyridoxamine 5'-phosphate oxidase family protein [Anaeromyxobacter dehalogenans]ACL63934.1 pyridoxamine 5'-phosphate oxidase-related FMN-binding [Anaeromyxobacter dehalogenans 2CP-1]
MGHRFAELAFTPSVRAVQEAMGSRAAYARMEAGPDHHDALGPDEAGFIAARDSFYLASVGETGWPYVQHRGGPPGFVRVLGPRTIGFADYRGNRQYVTVGNLAHDDRVALFFMDYPARTRLKLLGHARRVGPEDPALLAALAPSPAAARVERAFVVQVAAFDWNCSQHITPRWTAAEVEAAAAPLRARIEELERRLADALAAGEPGRR